MSIAASVIARRPNPRGDLSLLLNTLRDIDLSNDIFGKSAYLNAHGGCSDIFTAKSRRHGNITVAVKQIRVHIFHNKDVSKVSLFNTTYDVDGRNDSLAQMILRELRIWSSLDHPNVLRLLGYVMHGPYPALVSQWMVNGSARNYMEKFPNTSVVRMVITISHRCPSTSLFSCEGERNC